jgi:RNA polymerase sigma-70 factor (ECF subfamily)
VRVSRTEQEAALERFMSALRTGRLQELMDVLAPGVVLIADGGGVVPAVLVPLHGAGPVADLLARARRLDAGVEAVAVWLNGAPAARLEIAGEPAALSLTVEGGRITRLFLTSNPDKLTRLERPAELAR